MCPAGVYELPEDAPAGGEVDATVNYTNCVQCGEMTAVAGTVRMAMRIDLEERTPEQSLYHTVSAPGLGIWRLSDPRVKIYKYLKQVTNLSAPAAYRAVIRFRWLAPHGRVLKRVQRYTGGCTQPAPPPPAEDGQVDASTPPPSIPAPPPAA